MAAGYEFNFRLFFLQKRWEYGIKICATGPTIKAQIIVPSPKVPPSRKPAITKKQSVRMRTMPKGL